MINITIMTDGISCLNNELVNEYNIQLIPFNILSDGKIYREWVDINPSQAYELFLKSPDSFKTSPPSPEECFNYFRKAESEYILCISVSSKLSTFYNMAVAAKERAVSELPRTTIEVMNSETATAAQGFVVLAAARAAHSGKTFEEVIRSAEEMKKKVNTYILLDTIKHVYRSGRIPKVAAQAASVLNIKPLLTVSSGMVHFDGAVRNRKTGIERMLYIVRDKVHEYPVHIAVMHAYALEEAENLKKSIASEFNCAELWLSEFSPLMGYACGTGTLAVSFYVD